MKTGDVDRFERVQHQLADLHREMSILAKSKQDNPVNKFKLKMVNERLAEANLILVGPFKPLAGFDTFSEDELPTNSDVVLVLSQYLDSLEGWRSANLVCSGHTWYWDTDGGPHVQSTRPTRFRQAPGASGEKPQRQSR